MLSHLSDTLERYMDLLSARQKAGGCQYRQCRYARLPDSGHRFSVRVPVASGGRTAGSRSRRAARKNDGNNVSMDRETRLLAENSLRFQTASSLLRTRSRWCAGRSRREKRMSLFSAITVGASGMAAQRARAELLVENLANAETTRTPEGGPYRRKDAFSKAPPRWRFHRCSSRISGAGGGVGS